jgi:hypothetical protein
LVGSQRRLARPTREVTGEVPSEVTSEVPPRWWRLVRRNAGRLAVVPSSLAVIAIDAVNPRVVADFWCAVLGWVVLEEDEVGVSIGSGDGKWPTIDVCRVPEAKTVKNRLHFDLRADGVGQQVELQRLLDLGAKPVNVGQQPDVSWVVLADPEGNEFCLLARTVQEVVQG